ncbi:hypothetical protein RHMOL_Rhmol06G0303800 [Rhododendron molle]|uniref:Uncharacterized protein n=1 Tax=Rhododendron molle TaxID=49168 RepID=A0ACC0NK72_RHOML|nr:hypothetical protein RHMOL_Rhmol06G0303800 [Rhododendron molle]
MEEVITAADASSSLRSYSSDPSIGPWNLPLLCALLACALAQFLKPFTTWVKEKRWDSRRMVGSGGMPSSHSATVTALAAAVGLQEGTGGSAFAIAVVLACVVMYDASGVRLHAGRQAELLNQIVCELPPEHPVSSVKPLRDSLGHTPLQVVAGALLGWTKNNATGGANHLEVKASLPQNMKRLVKGYSQTQLEATGFACHSDVHTKVCVSNRPVTIDTGTMKVYAPLSQAMAHQANRTISPYPRREDKTAMELVSSVHILRGKIHPPPACDCTHDVPAVVFSSGGFTGDIFHEFNEVIIPLFLTSRHFQSRLRFIVTDFKPQFIAKFSRVLSHLSSYELINPAANGSVHCFPGAVVGLHYHDNLAIKATDVPKGYSMLDFKQFLRDSYNLKIRDLSRMKRPVLVLISRPKPRMFLNQNQMVTMMTLLGFRVVLAKPDMMANVDKFAKVLNLCSVLVGAHDAALTTEIFLPEGAVMVQVVGLGLEWASATYYGGPAAEMGLNYIEYKIEPEESSLISVYGRDDPVITNPESIASKGYTVGRTVYIEGQNFNISIARFRKTLVQALGLLGRSA